MPEKKEIEKLQKSIRILWYVYGVTVLLGAGLFYAVYVRSYFPYIEVGELVLTEDDAVLLRVSPTDSGAGGVETYSPQGQLLVAVSRTNRGGAITTFSDDGQEMVDVSTTKNGGYISTYDTQGSKIVSISKTGYGGDLRLFSRQGKESVVLTTVENGGAVSSFTSQGNMLYQP